MCFEQIKFDLIIGLLGRDTVSAGKISTENSKEMSVIMNE